MAQTQRPFMPVQGLVTTFAAGTTAQSVTFTTQINPAGATVVLTTPFLQGSTLVFPSTLQIDNQTNVAIFVLASPLASSTTATAANGYEIKAGDVRSIDVGQNDFVSVFPSASATGPVYLRRGKAGT